jgi:hypothetical protein
MMDRRPKEGRRTEHYEANYNARFRRPTSKQRLPHTPASVASRRTNGVFMGLWKKLWSLSPLPALRSGRGRSWEVLPTRFQRLCHFVPHEKRPPYPSTRVRFWAASAHTAWARMENKVTTSSAREGGLEPAFPACHSTTTTAEAALC